MGSWLVIMVEPRPYRSDDFHQVATLRGGEPVRSPIIQDQLLCFGDAAEQAGEATIIVGQFQFLEEAWHSFLDHGDAVATGRLRQCAAEPGLDLGIRSQTAPGP